MVSVCVGVVTSSPLRLELEFSPPPSDTLTWFICFTFVYTNVIHFTGNKLRQEISHNYV